MCLTQWLKVSVREINEYMAVKFFICIKMCGYCSCIANTIGRQDIHVCQMFVKEADGIVSYSEPSMEIMGGKRNAI